MSEKLSVEEWQELLIKLAQPFDTMDFLPRVPRDGKALALAYIDSRDVQTRLDNVCGPNWSFDFVPVSDSGKMVKGMLTIYGVTRCDAGESGPEDEPLKSAVSDALKRCGVLFGVGRYLYHLPTIRAPYDQQYKKWVEKPSIEARVISRAVALAIGQTLGEPSSYKQNGPMATSEEAARNRQEPAPESQGDRKATTQPFRPPAPTQAAPEAPKTNTGRVSPWAAGITSQDRVAEREAPAREERPARQAVTDSSVGNLHCQREGCGNTLSRGQHDISVRSFGKPYCPACQKLQANPQEEPARSAPASTREKSPLDTARDGYFAAFSEKFGKVSNEQRYAIEGVLIGWKRPMRTGEKDGWDVVKFNAATKRVRECDKQDVLRAAEDLGNVSQTIPLDPGATAPARGGDNYRPSMAH